MNDTPNLALPYILASQAQKHVTHNEAIRALDCLVQLAVESRALTAPPPTPSDGSRFIVGASATGAWAGRSGDVAAFQDGAWAFYEPKEGWTAWVADEHELFIYDADAWTLFAAGGGDFDPSDITELDELAHLGIATTADSTNVLALKGPASLFDNAGNGHQHKINKHAAADTASVLFQTNYSGRAEMGLAGDDDFHFKVSANGSTWYEAIKIDRSNGRVTFPCGTPREVLTANRTYYVRTDGNDGNTGLANNSGGAFLTLQRAVTAVGAIDLSTFNVTVQVGAGTYTTGFSVSARFVGSGNVTFQGDLTTPGNVIISTSDICISLATGAAIRIGGFLLTSSGSRTINVASSAGLLITGAMEYGASASDHILVGDAGSSCSISADYTISGNAVNHWRSQYGGSISCQARTITLTGTPAFSTAFATTNFGSVLCNGDTFSGSATGVRYSANQNGVIQTAGGGASYLPGSASGAQATGGQYL